MYYAYLNCMYDIIFWWKTWTYIILNWMTGILFGCKESDVGVVVCGPKSMRHEVANICASGLAQNLHFESISFNWWCSLLASITKKKQGCMYCLLLFFFLFFLDYLVVCKFLKYGLKSCVVQQYI